MGLIISFYYSSDYLTRNKPERQRERENRRGSDLIVRFINDMISVWVWSSHNQSKNSISISPRFRIRIHIPSCLPSLRVLVVDGGVG